MKEEFLHYVWKYQKFISGRLISSNGEEVRVIVVGQHNLNSGPDFFNSQLYIGAQLWVGNVELHLKASDWFVHRHEVDPTYDNVILHVVWENDSEIYRKDGTTISTVEIKDRIPANTISSYKHLFSKKHKWINCEKEYGQVEEFTYKAWLERLFVERLERKSEVIIHHLKKSNNHWESLLFELLCKNFGLKVNGEAFLSIAQSVDFSLVQKCSQDQYDLESLLFGQAGFLEVDKEDGYLIKLQNNYEYLKYKFNLRDSTALPSKFFRLRPRNFPTIRLSQLASLYSKRRHLFSEVIFDASTYNSVKSISELYTVFDVSASDYWDTHYNFGVVSAKRKKKLSKKFIDLLIINTIIPMQFCYAKQMGKDISEVLLKLTSSISAEENSIVKKYNELRPKTRSAFESQALLQLKTEYCNKMRCLDCAVGNAILNR
ncbi:MAG: hypothetical protein ACI840_000722 [Ulvibacter sp.]|jgi:hypothetical protein